MPRVIKCKVSRKKNNLTKYLFLVILAFAVILGVLQKVGNNDQTDIIEHQITPSFLPPADSFNSPTNTIAFKPTAKPTLTVTRTPISSQSFTIPEAELTNAINTFRRAHNLSLLKQNNGLCIEARKRAQELYDQNANKIFPPYTLGHEGFLRDAKDGTLGRLSGLTYFGENVASANCKRLSDNADVFVENATQLVEWCFDASEAHRENLLKADWTDVCSFGHYPFYVQIFGK